MNKGMLVTLGLSLVVFAACDTKGQRGMGQNPFEEYGVTQQMMEACRTDNSAGARPDVATLGSCLRGQGATVTDAQLQELAQSRPLRQRPQAAQ